MSFAALMRRFLIALAMPLMLTACGDDSHDETFEHMGFVFDTDLPKEHRVALIEDLNEFSSLSMKAEAEEFQKRFGIAIGADTPGTLLGWLRERVRYFTTVWTEEQEKEKLRVAQEKVAYSNTELPPTLEDKAVASFLDLRTATEEGGEKGSSGGSVDMANIGTAIYFIGKLKSTLYEAKIGGNWIGIPTPRTGVIAVSDHIFEKNSNAHFWRLYRLSILFHEGRHSDGRGKTLGFFHTKCPKGHDYEGRTACDSNANGPYAMSYVMLKSYMNECSDCTEKEKQMLKLVVADEESRIQKKDDFWDAEPEYK